MAVMGEIRRCNGAGAPDEEGAHLLPSPDDFRVGEDDE